MNTQNDNNDTNKFAQILLRDFIQSDFVNENDLNEIESYEMLINYVSEIYEHVMNDDVFVNATIENDINENYIYIDFRLCDFDELNLLLKFNRDDDDIKFMLNHKCVCNNIFEYDNDDDVDKLIINQKMIIDDNNNNNKKIENNDTNDIVSYHVKNRKYDFLKSNEKTCTMNDLIDSYACTIRYFIEMMNDKNTFVDIIKKTTCNAKSFDVEFLYAFVHDELIVTTNENDQGEQYFKIQNKNFVFEYIAQI